MLSVVIFKDENMISMSSYVSDNTCRNRDKRFDVVVSAAVSDATYLTRNKDPRTKNTPQPTKSAYTAA